MRDIIERLEERKGVVTGDMFDSELFEKLFLKQMAKGRKAGSEIKKSGDTADASVGQRADWYREELASAASHIKDYGRYFDTWLGDGSVQSTSKMKKAASSMAEELSLLFYAVGVLSQLDE